ncbi:NFACT RNA binding domain-containing protein [Hymenobacter cellulosilyticus]|uniref:NFACT RNA binding domain-containing protein n=1 Tax=Hymenobacter cellulosilyticus TaxID=2932248 RepID=A0A8T9Q4P2_9BACT|nr:NFACT RNA binding domain-containing protein [Hymenobacter cellulosilyticus]UOQ71401.1 NFACT RNA binding domain-containing protein [Hymenobacter cellulosilyticus]
MHNNYYFLRQLAPALTQQLAGFTVATCFSQEKDELVIGLTNGAAEFWFKAQLSAGFTALALPETFHRARTNSVDLLPGLLGLEVASVSVFPHDRVLQLNFQTKATLQFKLYGPRPNAVFRPAPGRQPSCFISATWPTLTSPRPRALPDPLNPLRSYPALGDVPPRYLRARGYDTADATERLRMVEEVVALLENPAHFYLTAIEGKTRLTLLPAGEVEQILAPDPVAALRLFVPLTLGRRAYETELRQVRQDLEKRAEEATISASQARTRLHALEHTAGYRQTADLIMANLTQIPAGAAQVEVVDFYQDNQLRTIKLKATETPQRTAQNLYRKAKNQKIETQQLQERIERRETEALWCLERLEELVGITELRALRTWRKTHDLLPETKAKEAAELPFKVFTDGGYTILVGRNAQNNDLLTQRYAHKDDLWLHAKDVTGSHVVIKQKAGQTIPEPVVERAAQLAAWYSRRKNDSLCPVTVTPKKFVRKRKGAVAGQVVVERERVVLVVPANPFERAG